MDPGAPDRSRHAAVLVAAALVTAVVVGAGAYWLGRTSAGGAMPGTASAEAGFARDMQVHHIQGVEMAMIVRDRTDDPDIRQLAYDIATTQGHQAGQLYGWLVAWGLNQLGPDPPMAWMGHTGHGMSALMPGMANGEQMAALADATGVEAERQFLRLMIVHHEGALEMAEAVLERSDHPAVRAFANAVLTSQQSEIDLMTRMLEERRSAVGG